MIRVIIILVFLCSCAPAPKPSNKAELENVHEIAQEIIANLKDGKKPLYRSDIRFAYEQALDLVVGNIYEIESESLVSKYMDASYAWGCPECGYTR